jgi:hypothetical protein
MSTPSGYSKFATLSPEAQTLLQQILQMAGINIGSVGGEQGNGNLAENPLYKQAVSATQGFLPGGTGFAPIQQEAQRNFQQSTIPSILNAFGSGSKGSSSLNQALAGAGQNLNTSLASQQAQMQLQAANQAGNLAQQPGQFGLLQAQTGLSTSPFGYTPKQEPFWQRAIPGLIQTAAKVGSSFI